MICFIFSWVSWEQLNMFCSHIGDPRETLGERHHSGNVYGPCDIVPQQQTRPRSGRLPAHIDFLRDFLFFGQGPACLCEAGPRRPLPPRLNPPPTRDILGRLAEATDINARL